MRELVIGLRTGILLFLASKQDNYTNDLGSDRFINRGGGGWKTFFADYSFQLMLKLDYFSSHTI